MAKKILFIVVPVLIIVTALTFTVSALMFKKTGKITTTITPATVSCELISDGSGSTINSLSVRNTGTVDAYVRICIVPYVLDSDGNISPSSSSVSVSYDSANWTKVDNYYVYMHSVSAGGTCQNQLLTSPISIPSNERVSVFAEAIQAEPSNAVQEAWNISPTN